ncbi:MAG: energy-coupling factor ABC transporter ATP-binding protein [Bacillota bacterium]
MLCLERVSLVYEQGLPGERKALSGVSLVVGPGERLGLCGPSGAGKSSLLLLAAGIYPPSAGRVRRPAGVRVGLVLQEPETALFAPTVREELAFGPRASGLEEAAIDDLVRSSLARVGLSAELLGADPLALPMAERRLVAIAAVLAAQPDLLLLDEPTAGLPARARARVIALVRSFPGTIIVASHDLDFLWRTCPRLAVLARGSLVAEGDWRDFIARPELLAAVGLILPPVPAVLAGLIRRGWAIEETGQDEEAAAAAILRGRPRRGEAG